MADLQNQVDDLQRSYNSANARAWALQAHAATLEARLNFGSNVRNVPAPIGIEYSAHTVKARLRGVIAELTVSNDGLKSDMGALRDLQCDPEFLGLCHEGTTAGSAFDAMGRIRESIKSSTGVVECAMCYEPIDTFTVMLGKNCHHLFCITCVESNMEFDNRDGVGNMKCPFRCNGTFSDREHMSLFKTAKDEVESEGNSLDVAAAVFESPDDNFNSMIETGVLVLDPFVGPAGIQWEEVKDGPRATTSKRKLGEDPTAHAPKLFLSKSIIKRLSEPFKFAQLGGGSKSIEALDELAKECGRDKGWVRRVAAPNN